MPALDENKKRPGTGVGIFSAHTWTIQVHRVAQGLMWLGGAVLLIFVFFTLCHVVGRFFFQAPIKGAVELIEIGMVIVFFTAIPYTTFRKGHVDVVLLVSRFPKRVQKILTAIMTLVGSVIFALVCWQLGLSAWEALSNGAVTTNLKIPLFPFKTLATIGAGIVALELLIHFITFIRNQK